MPRSLSDASRRDAGTSYLGAVRDRLGLIAAVVAVVVGIAALYSILADKVYEATAEVLVSPLPDDPAFAGLGVLTASRPAETTARLVTSREIADAVATRLGGASAEELLDSVDAHAVGDGNLVAVNGKAAAGTRAAQIANGFAEELVGRRSARFQSELAARIRRLREALGEIPAVRRDTPRAVSLDQQLGRLVPLVGGGDPTLEVVSDAVAPDDPAWPRPWLIVPLAALLALLAGALVAVLPVARGRRAEVEDELPVAAPAVASGSEASLAGGRAVEARVNELDDRERVLQERARDLEAARAQVDERVGAVTRREVALARRAAELAASEQERPATLPVPFTPPSSQTGPAQPHREAVWNLSELERLVAGRDAPHHERREELEAYLFLLRQHAGPDGNLPSSFDWLVADVFGDLIEEGEEASGGERGTRL